MGAPVDRHAGQPAGQFVGGRRGQAGGTEFFAVEDAQRADESRGKPGRIEDAGDQTGGRRLAVGSGDADDLQLAAGVSGDGMAKLPVGFAGDRKSTRLNSSH